MAEDLDLKLQLRHLLQPWSWMGIAIIIILVAKDTAPIIAWITLILVIATKGNFCEWLENGDIMWYW